MRPPLALAESRMPRSGAGRKRAEQVGPGCPGRWIRWRRRSLGAIRIRRCAGQRCRGTRSPPSGPCQGHPASEDAVRRLLIEARNSLQGNAEVLEGNQHPDRNAQVGYIHSQVTAYMAEGEPVVSVDTKEKELVGDLSDH
ncbi:hypothetical protein [Nonomuraea sp. NPDC049695]|uniref:ISAzo13-like element transposase-related protein n=1 Tax=Nonomuraea sp. NPDC049695 TaxID=3154734 RepID=UPI0034123CC4